MCVHYNLDSLLNKQMLHDKLADCLSKRKVTEFWRGSRGFLTLRELSHQPIASVSRVKDVTSIWRGCDIIMVSYCNIYLPNSQLLMSLDLAVPGGSTLQNISTLTRLAHTSQTWYMPSLDTNYIIIVICTIYKTDFYQVPLIRRFSLILTYRGWQQ